MDLMTRSDLQVLNEFVSGEDLVPIERIPLSFKPDFDRFFFGKTLVKKENGLFVYPHDIKKWVAYLFYIYKD